jgi:hypothetical protein
MRLEASNPELFFTKLTVGPNQSKFNSEEVAFAIQIKAGTDSNLRVHYDEQLKHLSRVVAEKANKDDTNLYSIMPVQDPGSADLGVALESGKIAFNILDEKAKQHGVVRMPATIPTDPEELFQVLSAAGHYFWHYRREPSKHQKSPVTIEFMMLQEGFDEGNGERTRVLEPCSGNLIEDKVISLEADDTSIYGIKVTNTGSEPLYVSAFFFDHSSLEIRT